jgi:hypothetical protein
MHRFNQTVTDEPNPRKSLALPPLGRSGGRGAVSAAVFTFETTHHALWAEEVAQEAGIPAEIIPAPPAAQARCNLALETLPEEVEHLADTLAAQGVPHGRWSPPD